MGRKGSPWVSFLGWRCLRASVAPGSVAPGSPRRPSPAPRTDPELWLARPKPAARLWRRRGLGPPGLPAPGSCRRPRSGAPSPGGRPGPGGPLGSLSSSPPPRPLRASPPLPAARPVAMAPLPWRRCQRTASRRGGAVGHRGRRLRGPIGTGPARPGAAGTARAVNGGGRGGRRRGAAALGCAAAWGGAGCVCAPPGSGSGPGALIPCPQQRGSPSSLPTPRDRARREPGGAGWGAGTPPPAFHLLALSQRAGSGGDQGGPRSAPPASRQGLAAVDVRVPPQGYSSGRAPQWGWGAQAAGAGGRGGQSWGREGAARGIQPVLRLSLGQEDSWRPTRECGDCSE